MRIIAGEYGGRRLKAVPGMKTRPTTDKVKEAMFNMIGPYFDGGQSLDLFAGSGGLSIEAVSRGITTATLIDHQYQAIKTIKDNIAVTKHPERFNVYKNDASRAIQVLARKGVQFDLVFFDPPYKQQQIVKMMTQLQEEHLLSQAATVVCETNQEANLPLQFAGFTGIKRANYGITQITIYRFGEG
ncbi:MAG TPA: 16S rRNA (guanine(966)-N(2))-methyltransferase RsmD [Candidatus Ligilactobacillus avistercoris]|nr:16S rRNA (guanine(966)-N(2))-methyltransferase RsmD [Candidatus Ligilactobacillus avistercoris]